MNTQRTTPFLLFLSLLAGTLLTAQTVDFVQWGSDYNMRRFATSPSDSTPVDGDISPDFSFSNQDLGIGTAGANDSYYGNTLTSYLAGMISPTGDDLSTRTFYHAVQQIRIDASPNTGNRNIGPTDSYSTQRDWRGNGYEQYHLYAWNQADFLNGNAVDLSDVNSSMEVTIRNFSNIETGSGARFVINNGGTWYYSQAFATSGTFTLNNPGAALWATFDPTSIDTTPRSMAMPNSGFGSVTFNDVQYVGFATEVIRGTSGNNNESRQGFDNFVFEAAAIPEPSTFMLVGISMMAFIGMRRLQR